MCKLKSGIILKDSVFVPDYDSHTNMLEELKIDDTRENASRLFVRAELYPKNGDVFSDIETWTFRVDQDIIPDWFVEEYDKSRMVDAVKKWSMNRIHIGIDNLTLNDGECHFVKDCKNVNICGSATVNRICGSATVDSIFDSATVKNIYGSTTVKNIYGSATVDSICDSATVNRICDSSLIITSRRRKWNNLHSVILLDSSTIKDNYGKVVYQSGDVKLVSVMDGKIEEV